MESLTPFQEMCALYRDYGGERYLIEETITQRAHVLQGALIARMAGAPENFTVAVLLHDIGQIADHSLVGNTEVLHHDHAEMGERWLRDRGFPDLVAKAVGYHALAKVILCQEIPDYARHLSQASLNSLVIQREKYASPAYQRIVQEFKTSPYVHFFKNLRLVDDMAKINDWDVSEGLPDFSRYEEAMDRVGQGRGLPATNPFWEERINRLYQTQLTHPQDLEKEVKAFALLHRSTQG